MLHTLAAVEGRSDAAREIAQALAVEELLLYVKDPVLDVMLPAPGMPKTLAGGPRWREFLRRCMREPRPQASVDVPVGRDVPASAIACHGAAVILLGDVQPGILDELADEFPLMAALLVAQVGLHIERAEGARAREAAAQAQDLAQALDRARAASAELNLQLRDEHRRKDEFLAMLAHELRNPLSPLVHSVELLRRAGSDNDRHRRPLEVMERQLQQLTRLVDDLLDVSRVSRGSIELRREPLLLSEVLEDAVDAARPVIEARAHELQCGEVPPGLAVNADRVRLTQVLVNLLANAAKYTEPGGRITIAVVVDERRVSIVVQDNGIGIPQDMLSRVFDMFTQLPAAQSASPGGLGIGLTLARRLVELHGGRISAYSRGKGLGSTFTVSLPQQVLGQLAAVPRASPAAVNLAAALGARPRVLVVDDNPDGADTLAALVDCMGADARIARDGEMALELVPDFDPHLILLDIGLPGMDGYETARRLRKLPHLHAMLVALTGYGAPQDRERTTAAGFDGHLVKPLSPEAAQDLLQKLALMHAAS